MHYEDAAAAAADGACTETDEGSKLASWVDEHFSYITFAPRCHAGHTGFVLLLHRFLICIVVIVLKPKASHHEMKRGN